ncbi:MAG: thiolase family protein [Rhodothermales bacterium]|nr:thiolase family protein [Rhodothermales bacterium]
MRDVFIASAVRTPIGRFGGTLKDFTAADLGAHAMKAALARAGVNGSDLDFYIMGNVLRGGQGQLIPRQAAFKAGIPDNVDGMAIDMVCSSGMMSVMQAATMIRAGEAEVVLAGGMESMSTTGFYLSARARWGYKFLMGQPEGLTDLVLYDGLTDPMSGEAMGDQSERLAAEEGVTREMVDEVAFLSNQRAAEATQKGYFSAEIAPIEYRERKEVRVMDRDEGIRPETTMASLGGLKPAFGKDGVLTAGNSSQLSDGAAALVLAGGDAVKRLGLKPLARIARGAWSAGPSWRFIEAPVAAVERVQKQLGWSVSDIDLFENNEAFALSSVLFRKKLGVPYEKLNVHGGGIALGHPIGCSGARILVTLLHALVQQNKKRGLASLCHGTGGGTAVAVERV